jgi:hypothetical protein
MESADELILTDLIARSQFAHGASLRQFRQHLRHRKPMSTNTRFTSTPHDLSPDMIRVYVHFCRPSTVREINITAGAIGLIS